MTELVFFLEERSAQAMLEGVLPRILPEAISIRYVVFEGKQDLEKQLTMRLQGWLKPDSKFVIMRDQDNGNCQKIKTDLAAKCIAAKQPDTLIRIACRELESFYLGDLKAVAQAIGPGNLAGKQDQAKYRNPDLKIQSPAQELKRIAPAYQKISGSRAIGKVLDTKNNSSRSFNVLIAGIQRLITNT